MIIQEVDHQVQTIEELRVLLRELCCLNSMRSIRDFIQTGSCEFTVLGDWQYTTHTIRRKEPVTHLCKCVHLTYHPEGHARPSYDCVGCRTCKEPCHCGCKESGLLAMINEENLKVWATAADHWMPVWSNNHHCGNLLREEPAP